MDESQVFTLEDGTRVKRLRNGTLYDVDKKRFHSGPDPEHYPIQSSEDGRALAMRRVALAKERAREGALLAALDRGMDVHDASEAWREILRVRAGVALDNVGRDGNDATRLVGRAAGFTTDESSDDSPARARVTVTDASALVELASKIDQEVEKRVQKALAIDAQVSD